MEAEHKKKIQNKNKANQGYHSSDNIHDITHDNITHDNFTHDNFTHDNFTNHNTEQDCI